MRKSIGQSYTVEERRWLCRTRLQLASKTWTYTPSREQKSDKPIRYIVQTKITAKSQETIRSARRSWRETRALDGE